MSDLPSTVAQIGAAVVQLVSNVQIRPLNEGRVLFGREFVDDTRAPNSIVIVPTGGSFGPPQATSDASGLAPAKRRLERPLWSETTNLEVHVWGAATPSNPADDIRVTQFLYRCVLQACFRLATTQLRPGGFQWASQQSEAVTREGLGQYFVFTLSVSSVVTDQSVNFVPPGTRIVPTQIVNPQ